jgi:hypothetical protein
VPYENAPQNLRVNLLRNRDEYKNGSGMEELPVKKKCPIGEESDPTDPQHRRTICTNKVGAYVMVISEETLRPKTHKENYGRTVTPSIRQSLDAKFYNKIYRATFINPDGSGKTIKEIVEANLALPNIASNESCYYLNPPVDPDEQRSLLEYVNTPAVAIQSTLIKSIEKEIDITDAEQQQLYVPVKLFGNCTQIVNRHFTAQIAAQNQAEFSSVAGVPSGTFKSPGSAVRIELNGKEATRSIYLPIRGFSAADRLGAMFCQSGRIFINFGGTNGFQIMEYDLNAKLLNKWEISVPPEVKNGRYLADLGVDKQRVSIKLVDFERSGENQGKKISAKLNSQYFLEAKIPSEK